jgi:hypothetical protein
VYYRLSEKLLSTEFFFLLRASKTPKILKVKNDVIRDKKGVTQTVMEIMGGGDHVKMVWLCIPNGK